MDENFKRRPNEISMSRVKTIMKSSPDIENISQESVFLVTKATEMFIKQMVEETLNECGNVRTLEYKHVSDLVESDGKLAFLREIVPQKTTLREIENYQKENGLMVLRPGTSPPHSEISYCSGGESLDSSEPPSPKKFNSSSSVNSSSSENRYSGSAHNKSGSFTGSCDTSMVDEVAGDAGSCDTSMVDEVAGDTGSCDTSMVDEVAGDTGSCDTSMVDEVAGDTGSCDTSMVDEVARDTGSCDTSMVDEVAEDSGSCDTSMVDEVAGDKKEDPSGMESDSSTEVSVGKDSLKEIHSPISIVTVSSSPRSPNAPSPSPSYSSLSSDAVPSMYIIAPPTLRLPTYIHFGTLEDLYTPPSRRENPTVPVDEESSHSSDCIIID